MHIAYQHKVALPEVASILVLHALIGVFYKAEIRQKFYSKFKNENQKW